VLRREKIEMQISQESSPNPNPIVVAVLVGILAFIAPTSITLAHNGKVSLVNLGYPLWSVTAGKFEWAYILPLMTSSYWDYDAVLFFELTIILLLFLGLRIAFSLQAMRYYQGVTTRKRTLLVGVMSSFIELFSWIPYLIPYGRILLPLPILFILGTLLLCMTEEPLIKPPPLRREPIIIFSLILFILNNHFFTLGDIRFLWVLFIVALVVIEFRRK
jgi:hypothetical protein